MTPEPETLTRAELVQRADQASGKARYAIWDLIAALDAKQAEGQAEPRDEAKAVLDECWPDPETRFGGNSPVTVRPIAVPPGFQMIDEPVGLHLERMAEALNSVAAKRGSTVCPKNNGRGHRFISKGLSPSAHKFPLERCRKCYTTRTIYPEGHVRPKRAVPAERKDDRVCPKTQSEHRWRTAPETDGIRRNECRDCRTRRKVAA